MVITMVGPLEPLASVKFERVPDAGNLVAHYEGKSGALNSGSPATDGQAVNTWEDQSGNGWDLSAIGAPTYLEDQLNGYPAIRFDGVDDGFGNSSFTETWPATIYAVASPQGSQGGDTEIFSCHLSGTPLAGTFLMRADRGNNEFQAFSGSSLFYTRDWGVSGYSIFNAVFDSTSSEVFEDGVSEVSGNTGTRDAEQLSIACRSTGPDNFFQGDYVEVLAYGVAHGSTERAAVEEYVNRRYGLF